MWRALIGVCLLAGACAGDDSVEDCIGNDCVCTDAEACDIDCGNDCNAVCERSTSCASSCGHGCDVVCRDAEVCSAGCGDGCIASCERVDSCIIDCGEDCDVLCSDVLECDVTLASGSITCDAAECTITCLIGGVVECGGGRFACDPAWC